MQAAARELGEGPSATRKPLTSLAPLAEGGVRAAIVKGEAALKKKDYDEALESFMAAGRASTWSPESQLSVFHARLAMADKSYDQAAKHLGLTLRAFPALAMVPVRPEAFYAEGEYQRILSQLETRAEALPRDPEAMFVLGYLRWRGGQFAESQDVLADAVTASKDRELTKSIDLLLDSIGAVREDLIVDAPKMQPAVDYAWGGIRLALPANFRPERISEVNRIVLASAGTEKAPRKISLSVYPAGDRVDLGALMDSIARSINDRVGVTDMKTEGEAEVAFLDGRALVRTMTCTYAGMEIVVARLCFLRDVSDSTHPNRHLAYVLGMGMLAEKADGLLPAVAAVARSAEWIDFRQPIDLPLSKDSHPVNDPRWGYSIRQPIGWAGAFSESGFAMGQFDCVLGGAVTPRVEVICADVDAAETPKSIGEKAIETKVEEGYTMTVLSQGPAKLAGLDGYQFILKKEAPPAGAGQSPVVSIEVGRLICVAGKGEQQRMLALVARCQGATPKQAQAALDAVASSFALLKSDK
jgi:hypothetical protein